MRRPCNETPAIIMPSRLIDVIRDQTGATAIEYGLISGAIAMLIIGAVGSIGESLLAWFQILADAL